MCRLAAACAGIAWLAGCAAKPPAADAAALDASAWVLESLAGQPAWQGAPASLRFEGGRAQGSDGCNRYFADYSASGANLAIAGRGAAGTQMACPDGRMRQARAFMDALRQTRAYRVDGGKLALLDGAGGTLATFAAQRQALAGPTWRVASYNNGKQAVVSVLRETELSLAFTADGHVSGSAGCNRYTGSYAASGAQLSITSVAATRRLCASPKGIMEQEGQFLKALESAASARFEGRRLELRTADRAIAVVLDAVE
jgi:heat shock protein HslJ